ncbi:MAG: DUF4411 family protein [Deltaproteobacteria bacterium]|jgi:hypothetical protein|nr:DUF4411 family protein [Deltaproteobacteria bacterium]
MDQTILVLDTEVFFTNMLITPMGFFTEFYEIWSQGFKAGYLVSVDAVYDDLQKSLNNNRQRYQLHLDWLLKHKSSFQDITAEESRILRWALADPKNRALFPETQLLAGWPQPNALAVAKAASLNGVMVTNALYKDGYVNNVIDLCLYLDVPYIDIFDFNRALYFNVGQNKPFFETVEVQNASPVRALRLAH